MRILFKRFPSVACKLLIVSFFLFNFNPAFASQPEPTKAELLATVRHIGAIAQQQQKDLDSEKAQHEVTQKSLTDAQTVEIPALKNAISDQATALAAAQAKVIAVEASRHGWVKRFWMVTGLLILAGLWIFKKPIMMALGGLGGI